MHHCNPYHMISTFSPTQRRRRTGASPPDTPPFLFLPFFSFFWKQKEKGEGMVPSFLLQGLCVVYINRSIVPEMCLYTLSHFFPTYNRPFNCAAPSLKHFVSTSIQTQPTMPSKFCFQTTQTIYHSLLLLPLTTLHKNEEIHLSCSVLRCGDSV